MLQKFPHLKHLSLHSNQIRSLPKEISCLQVETLDLSENPLVDLSEACLSLSSMPRLRHLVIDLSDEEEVEIVLSHLENIQTLNEKEISNDEQPAEQMMGDHQHELEHIAEL